MTTQCGAVTNLGGDVDIGTFNFACNNTLAGLNMTRNFNNLGSTAESYVLSRENASSTLPKNIPNIATLENVNTISSSAFGFGFQYFYDSARQEQARIVRSEEPIINVTNQYF